MPTKSKGPIKQTIKRRAKQLGLAVLCLGVLCCALIGYKAATLPPLDLEAAYKTSITVADRNGRLLRPYATDEGRWRLPITQEDLDPRYLEMLLTYEDKRFYEHHGIDPLAFMRAAVQLATSGKILSGGSTLTMQLARLLDGLETRSFDSKLTQLIRAFELERKLSKKQILELYLSLAPFGGNLEGVRAASLAYFGKEPKRLSWSERALLVALPQSPESRRPDRFNRRAQKARDRVLDRMTKAGLISASENAYAKRARVPKTRKRFPMLAAHLADKEVAKAPDQSIHQLTIDRPLQTKLETITRQHVQKRGDKLSAAILVADHSTGEVIGYVGSSGYLDQTRFGAIDMVDAIRSPGSTLKPFIYGLAFEQGLAHPETLIEDQPTRFGAYAPKNFDKIYRGTMTIRTALQTSRNIPAVQVLDAVGPARLAHRFEQANKKLEVPRNLSIALGGFGISLKSLTELYTGIARDGQTISLTTKPASHKSKPSSALLRKPLFSELAAWYVADILVDAPAPTNASSSKIAFKTGTSYGYRDAWAIGFDGRHVIGVWIGRPDATPTPGLMGIKDAAPLLFEAFGKISDTRVKLKRAPATAIMKSTANLPKRLIHFDESAKGKQDSASSPKANAVRISFPPNKAELEFVQRNDEAPAPIALRAEGGNLPLTWLADGKPIEQVTTHSNTRRNIFWSPPHQGFHKLTVIDANGNADRISIRLR